MSFRSVMDTVNLHVEYKLKFQLNQLEAFRF